mmetsp:Transcript_17337/g.29512  ORF Transcript_17337/g.29512 Transcript_17337/m.29512 type:complete len:235 (+) Transcript_17337:1416-2120(+)
MSSRRSIAFFSCWSSSILSFLSDSIWLASCDLDCASCSRRSFSFSTEASSSSTRPSSLRTASFERSCANIPDCIADACSAALHSISYSFCRKLSLSTTPFRSRTSLTSSARRPSSDSSALCSPSSRFTSACSVEREDCRPGSSLVRRRFILRQPSYARWPLPTFSVSSAVLRFISASPPAPLGWSSILRFMPRSASPASASQFCLQNMHVPPASNVATAFVMRPMYALDDCDTS